MAKHLVYKNNIGLVHCAVVATYPRRYIRTIVKTTLELRKNQLKLTVVLNTDSGMPLTLGHFQIKKPLLAHLTRATPKKKRLIAMKLMEFDLDVIIIETRG